MDVGSDIMMKMTDFLVNYYVTKKVAFLFVQSWFQLIKASFCLGVPFLIERTHEAREKSGAGNLHMIMSKHFKGEDARYAAYRMRGLVEHHLALKIAFSASDFLEHDFNFAKNIRYYQCLNGGIEKEHQSSPVHIETFRKATIATFVLLLISLLILFFEFVINAIYRDFRSRKKRREMQEKSLVFVCKRAWIVIPMIDLNKNSHD